MGQSTETGTAQMVSLRVGDQAPEFELSTVNARRVSLSDLRGRRVVLWLSRGIY